MTCQSTISSWVLAFASRSASGARCCGRMAHPLCTVPDVMLWFGCLLMVQVCQSVCLSVCASFWQHRPSAVQYNLCHKGFPEPFMLFMCLKDHARPAQQFHNSSRTEVSLPHSSVSSQKTSVRMRIAASVSFAALLPCRKSGWDIDCVVPVPDGSRPAAIQISAELGLPYREGLVKNRYVGRTFIMPDQRTRELSVRRKLNAMPAVFSGKSVLLVDDSIVRGTTMSQIVDMVRKAGAKKVRGLTATLHATCYHFRHGHHCACANKCVQASMCQGSCSDLC